MYSMSQWNTAFICSTIFQFENCRLDIFCNKIISLRQHNNWQLFNHYFVQTRILSLTQNMIYELFSTFSNIDE